MKKLLISASLVAFGAGGALAGGLDRSGQGTGVIFEEGNYVELTFGYVMPDVSGLFGGTVPSGDMAGDYTQFGLAVKKDISENLSFAIILDQPFGASVDYPGSPGDPYPFAGTTAEISSMALTAIGRYKLGERVSVMAGARYQTLSGTASIPPVGGYTLDVSSGGGVGYLVGAAYEIPDIALRVAVTYNSPISQTLSGTEFGGPVSFTTTTPQSVNLDFQTGIAADTLLFGSVRWADWSAFDITPPGYLLATTDSLVSYANDVTTYNVGIGRRFSDTLSGSVSLGYEAAQGGLATNLAPTDGYYSIQVGGQYTMDDMVISGGIRYVMLGDATTETIGSDFSGNSAVGLGIKVGYRF